MTLRILIPLGFLLGAAAGCADPADGPIDYEVTGGIGGVGDGTSLHVEPDGTATRTSPHKPPVTEKLDAATFGDLRRKVADARFPDLAPHYGCGGCADQFVHEISVELDGQHYKVAVDIDESVSYPDGLRTLLGTLQQIATR